MHMAAQDMEVVLMEDTAQACFPTAHALLNASIRACMEGKDFSRAEKELLLKLIESLPK